MIVKSFLLTIFILFAVGFVKAQDKYRMITDEITSKQMLIGFCDRNAFTDTSFSSWFNDEYENYNIDSSTINLIADDIKKIDLTIVLGTWCSDSREQIPRLLKILNFVYYPDLNIQMLAVDRNKKAENYDIDYLKIELVPTIILYKADAEIGRIVESPQTSLEEDMVDIILSSR